MNRSRLSRSIPRPWLHDLLALDPGPKLDRAAFVARYMPQYARDYRPPVGIRLNARGLPAMSTAGSVQAQITKRERRIDEAFALYCADYDGQRAFDARAREAEIAAGAAGQMGLPLGCNSAGNGEHKAA